MRTRQFGVSTHLYQDQRLCREHLLEIAAHGFGAVELFARRTHFDYHSVASVADLQQWLAEASLELTSVHAPVGEGAPEEAEQALYIARRIPVKVFVLHLEGSRDAARRTVERLAEIGAPLGVKIAIEIVLNELSRPGSLVHFVEDDLDSREDAGPAPGICLDIGHAHIAGDLVDTIESVSEHLIAMDVHDNRGRQDDHLVPFEGTVDWPSALTTVQKVGYEGVLTFELSARGTTKDALRRARTARERFEKLLCTSM